MLTPDQIAQRRRGIGGSDIPALLGISRFNTPLGVFLEKRGEVDRALVPNEAIEWGNRLEPVIRSAYADRLAAATGATVHVVPGDAIGTREGPEPWMLWTVDGLVWLSGRPDAAPADRVLEIKNRHVAAEGWGESGSDQVPQEVFAQVMWYLHCGRVPTADVAALFGGNELRIFRVDYDPQLGADLERVARSFWFECVQAGQPPEPTGGDHQRLATLFRQASEELVEADADAHGLVMDLLAARAEREAAEARVELLEARVKARIGEAAGLRGPDWKATWKTTKPSQVTNWRAVAEAVQAPADVIAAHTEERPGSRRFLLSTTTRKAVAA